MSSLLPNALLAALINAITLSYFLISCVITAPSLISDGSTLIQYSVLEPSLCSNGAFAINSLFSSYALSFVDPHVNFSSIFVNLSNGSAISHNL